MLYIIDKFDTLSHFTVIKTSQDASVMSRAFACIADVLGCKAENQGGLRSGPAANHLWKKGYSLLEVSSVFQLSLTALISVNKYA